MLQSIDRQTTADAPAIRLNLLGPLEVLVDGRDVSSALPAKSAALLCYLAVTGRPQPRHVLASLLWGDSPDAGARLSLRTALWGLGPLLGPCLEATRQTVALRPGAFTSDAADLLRLTGRARHEDGGQSSPMDAGEALANAAALYRGEMLAGWTASGASGFEEWLVAERQRFLDMALGTLYLLAVQHARSGAYDAAVAALRRLLALEPWHEEAHRQLMRLLALSGRRSEALKQYRICRRLLVLELGTEPTLETQSYYQELLAADRRVRAGARYRRTPLPAPPVLPSPPALVGREGDLAAVSRLLLDPARRPVTITGAGGCGKTALALAAARHLAGEFPDGTWYADASAGFWQPLAQALAVTGSPDDLASLVTARLSRWRCLLLLDGMESCPEAAEPLAALLAAAPGIAILATSRRRLGLRGESVVRLAGLRAPHDHLDTDPASSESWPAVRLLADLGARSGAGPASADDWRTLAGIARLCGGLPLVLELAVETAAGRSWRGVHDLLAGRPDLLTAPWADAPVRQRSLAASFAHTWRLLEDAERAAARALANAPGSFDLARAEAAGVPAASVRELAEWCLLDRPAPGWYAWAPLAAWFAGRME